ncbi:Uncharacterized protein APZ42_022999 [Daphnia magna]|uniref:Uncharacterized protein n=1 Tax=Daphnia magna TaxID=35525 RepID=A0A164VBY6_9CRUS|nr:Uncharacterized protein APZ42_022999 [Daphnia magna]
MNIECAKTLGKKLSALGTDVVQTASIYRFNSYAQFYRLTRLPFRSTFDYSAVLMVRKIANEKGQFLTSNAVVTVTRRILAVSTTHGPAAVNLPRDVS